MVRNKTAALDARVRLRLWSGCCWWPLLLLQWCIVQLLYWSYCVLKKARAH